jgi:hypothetical protein
VIWGRKLQRSPCRAFVLEWDATATASEDDHAGRQSVHGRHELIAAGMSIMAGGGNGTPLDYDELERWTRVGYERGMRSRKGER